MTIFDKAHAKECATFRLDKGLPCFVFVHHVGCSARTGNGDLTLESV